MDRKVFFDNINSVIKEEGKISFIFDTLKNGDTTVTVSVNFSGSEDYKSSSKTQSVHVKGFNMIFLDNNFSSLVSCNYIYYSFICFIFILTVFLLLCFIRNFRDNKYSYKCMLYMGGFIFTFNSLIAYVIGLIYSLTSYDDLNMKVINAVTSNVSTLFTVLSMPLLFAFGLLLIISNIKLMKMEGKKKINALGIGLSFCIFTGIIVVLLLFYYSKFYYPNSLILLILSLIISFLFVLFESYLLASIICAFLVCLVKPKYNADFCIILGSKVFGDDCSPLLKGRVDRAVKFYYDQYNFNKKKMKFVCSGGKGIDEKVSEASAIKKYLLSLGFSDKDILLEDKSTSTIENMKFSKNIIDKEKKNANIIFSTTSYHLFRSGIIADSLGYNFDGIGGKTKWYFWPNAFVREIIALVFYQKKKQLFYLILFTLIICIFAILHTFI